MRTFTSVLANCVNACVRHNIFSSLPLVLPTLRLVCPVLTFPPHFPPLFFFFLSQGTSASSNSLTRKANATNQASPVFLSPKSGIVEKGCFDVGNDKSMSFPGLDKDTILVEQKTTNPGQRLYQDAKTQMNNRKSAMERQRKVTDKELADKTSADSSCLTDSLGARASKSQGKESWMAKSKDDRYGKTGICTSQTGNHLDKSVENPFLAKGGK